MSSEKTHAHDVPAAIDVPGIHEHVRSIVLPWWEQRRQQQRRHHNNNNNNARNANNANNNNASKGGRKSGGDPSYLSPSMLLLPDWAHSMIYDTVHLVLMEDKAERKLNLRRPDRRSSGNNNDTAAATTLDMSEVDACLCAHGLPSPPPPKPRGGRGAAAAEATTEIRASGFSADTVYRVDARACPGLALSSPTTKEQEEEDDEKKKKKKKTDGAVRTADSVVAVKVTDIGKDLRELEGWKREAKMSRKAGELGVGPRVRDAFVCQRANRAMFGFIVTDLVRGVSLADAGREMRRRSGGTWMRSSRAGRRPMSLRLRRGGVPGTALSMLDKDLVAKVTDMFHQKRKRLNDAGIIHGDLGPANLIIVPSDAAAMTTRKKGRRSEQQASPVAAAFESAASGGGDAFTLGGPEDVADVMIIGYEDSTVVKKAKKQREGEEEEGREEGSESDAKRYARLDPFFWEEDELEFVHEGHAEEERALEELVAHVRDKLVAEGVIVPWTLS